uniref:Uncharacterized protein n=1 Tax=Hordeum vulgare subsp. vulgare TaxID=112509 RepID=A0A023IN90_HORVV|nr:hypothetical protein [Hordeum vulgare subsp. vulgare]
MAAVASVWWTYVLGLRRCNHVFSNASVELGREYMSGYKLWSTSTASERWWIMCWVYCSWMAGADDGHWGSSLENSLILMEMFPLLGNVAWETKNFLRARRPIMVMSIYERG